MLGTEDGLEFEWSPREGLVSTKKLIVPKFATEAEEAQWWDDHMDIVEENLIEALENGTIGHGIVKRLADEGKLSKSPKKSSGT